MDSNNELGILTFVPDLWENYWMSRHYVMSGLSRYFKILWVSPPIHWRDSIRLKSTKISARGLKKISPSFWVYSPEQYLPSFYGKNIISRFFDEVRRKRIKRICLAMGIKILLLYLWRPIFGNYIGQFNEELVCYHIDDEYTFSEIDKPISENEARLIQTSDVVFIHSKTLMDKKGRLNPETYYVPNGVDFDHFCRTIDAPHETICEIDEIPKPRIGYIGYIKKQIDLDLILMIARNRKDWSIVLVGPIIKTHLDIKIKIQRLQKEKNVYFIGAKKPADLPHYIQKMDVCLMCYEDNEYTKYIYPMKLHEYLACGKPVVATPLPNLVEYKNIIYFANGVNNWIRKINFALSNENSSLKRRRIAVAKENSWENRVDLIRKIFQRKLQSL